MCNNLKEIRQDRIVHIISMLTSSPGHMIHKIMVNFNLTSYVIEMHREFVSEVKHYLVD